MRGAYVGETQMGLVGFYVSSTGKPHGFERFTEDFRISQSFSLSLFFQRLKLPGVLCGLSVVCSAFFPPKKPFFSRSFYHHKATKRESRATEPSGRPLKATLHRRPAGKECLHLVLRELYKTQCLWSSVAGG